MTDKFSKEVRSRIMSRIRSEWTGPEKMIHNKLKGLKIRHQMHPKIAGHPDLILKDRKVAVFIHGCFWHKCPKCYKEPKSRKKYWIPKIKQNVKRDIKNENILRQNGYKIIKIWEHELKGKADYLRRITK